MRISWLTLLVIPSQSFIFLFISTLHVSSLSHSNYLLRNPTLGWAWLPLAIAYRVFINRPCCIRRVFRLLPFYEILSPPSPSILRTVLMLTSCQSSHLTPPASIHQPPSRPQSQPYEQPSTYQHQQLQASVNIPKTFALDPQLFASGTPSPSVLQQMHSPAMSPVRNMNILPQWNRRPTSNDVAKLVVGEAPSKSTLQSGRLAHPKTWSVQSNQLQVPRSHARERSSSQPPSGNHSRSPSDFQGKKKSSSNFGSRPGSVLQEAL